MRFQLLSDIDTVRRGWPLGRVRPASWPEAAPGVVAAGWTSGSVEMDRTIRFAAAEWRDGDKINKDKIASSVSNVLAKTLAAKPAAAAWNANTGKLKLTFKRPSQVYPALGLTESVEITALVSADKPNTRSPTATSATPSPSSSTTPAAS